jgi:hypothetical protein
MDPITAGIVTATVIPLAAGAAGEAGKQAWLSLASFVRGRFGRQSTAGEAVEALSRTPDDIVQGQIIGRVLEDSAAEDQQVAEWVQDWLARATPLAQQAAGAVTNTISGQAQVHGGAVQSGTINGPITFGRDR